MLPERSRRHRWAVSYHSGGGGGGGGCLRRYQPPASPHRMSPPPPSTNATVVRSGDVQVSPDIRKGNCLGERRFPSRPSRRSHRHQSPLAAIAALPQRLLQNCRRRPSSPVASTPTPCPPLCPLLKAPDVPTITARGCRGRWVRWQTRRGAATTIELFLVSDYLDGSTWARLGRSTPSRGRLTAPRADLQGAVLPTLMPVGLNAWCHTFTRSPPT